MPYVITQPCCNEASCLDVCPVDCIRPTPEEAAFKTTEMLYIDPDTCIDCGACADACPVDAIFPADELTERSARYQQINADYFEAFPLESSWDAFSAPTPASVPSFGEPIRVAIVGTGPSACYAAMALTTELGQPVEVEMFDRLPTPWGLVRAGVAPDHLGTKSVTKVFQSTLARPEVQLHLNVEVGVHITHEELMTLHQAVIYATGASEDRRLEIPGEDLPGSHSATAFVAWYNGHPDYAHQTFDLSGERAVIVGNGNVALDVARILVSDPDALSGTDIAEHALDALRKSNIREVILLGRRGPAQAAYTSPELMALGDLDGVDVLVDAADLVLDPRSRALVDSGESPSTALKVSLAQEFADRALSDDNKRIVLRYLTAPTEIIGSDRVTGLRIVHNELIDNGDGHVEAQPTDQTEIIETGLVLRSIGYRSAGVPGLPDVDNRGTLPNADGRVIDEAGQPLAGVYTTGWLKRGSTGVIGTNKHCANGTVKNLIEDLAAEKLSPPEGDRTSLNALIRERQPEAVSYTDWEAIDEAERAGGAATGRPRLKITEVTAMLDIVKQARRIAAGE